MPETFAVPTTEKSIAVLPFTHMGRGEENEFFCDGITEEIINALAQIRNLRVTSRTSSFYFKGKNIPLKDIARQLNVTTILEGSVRMAAGKVRITAQLIDARTDSHFWSETWERQMENIFEIQDEVSLKIADKLREHQGHIEFADHLVPRPTQNLTAYALYLEARYHFNKWNPADVEKAITLFEKALSLDAQYTEACVGLADAYSFMATTESMPREEAWEKSITYTEQAYRLNPENAGVHYLLANKAFFTACNYADSFRHIQRSLELKPTYPEALQFMAFLYMLSDEMERAHDYLQLALGTDPMNRETQFFKAYYLYRSERYAEAREAIVKLLEENPENMPAFVVNSYCLLKTGQYDEVRQQVQNAPTSIAIPDEMLGIKCLAAIMQGNDEASPLLEQLKETASTPTAFVAHSYLFMAYANLKQADEAFNWLHKALQMKSSVLLLSFSDPLTRPVQHDARYKEHQKALYNKKVSIKKKQPNSSAFPRKRMKEYAEKISLHLENEKPYLNPALTLRELAGQIDIHPNQLSWLLNEHFGKKFNSFINGYRVAYFQKLAALPENDKISIIGLAYESGFNSKTVFNTFFKKETGLTPNEFIKQIR